MNDVHTDGYYHGFACLNCGDYFDREFEDVAVVSTVVPEEADPAPDVGSDPVVIPRPAVCNNWERWTDGE